MKDLEVPHGSGGPKTRPRFSTSIHFGSLAGDLEVKTTGNMVHKSTGIQDIRMQLQMTHSTGLNPTQILRTTFAPLSRISQREY